MYVCGMYICVHCIMHVVYVCIVCIYMYVSCAGVYACVMCLVHVYSVVCMLVYACCVYSCVDTDMCDMCMCMCVLCVFCLLVGVQIYCVLLEQRQLRDAPGISFLRFTQVVAHISFLLQYSSRAQTGHAVVPVCPHDLFLAKERGEWAQRR